MRFFTRVALVASTALAMLAVPAAALASGPPGPASGELAPGAIAYEYNTGQSWTVTPNPAAVSKVVADMGYADVGVVVTTNGVDSLSSLRLTGDATHGADLFMNVWVYQPGTALTGTHAAGELPATFAYGYVTFEEGGPYIHMFNGAYSGQALTLDQLQADYPGYGCSLWVGITYSPEGPVWATVTSVEGQPIGTRYLSISPVPGHVDGFPALQLVAR